MYREEILENRLKWIKFLNNKDRKKAIGMLENPKQRGARCCLGHACHVLGIPRVRIVEKSNYFNWDGTLTNTIDITIFYGTGEDKVDDLAPEEVVKLLGLWDSGGGTKEGCIEIDGESEDSLAELNDNTEITPKGIAKYLKTVTEGGTDTPFRPLTDYPMRP